MKRRKNCKNYIFVFTISSDIKVKRKKNSLVQFSKLFKLEFIYHTVFFSATDPSKYPAK